VGIRDVHAGRTAAIRTLTHKLPRLEMRRIFKQRSLEMVVISSLHNSDDAMDDLGIVGHLDKW